MRSTRSLPRPRKGAVVTFCLAAERVDLDDQTWLEAVTAATLPMLPPSDDYAAVCISTDRETLQAAYTHAYAHGDLPLLRGSEVGNVAATKRQRRQIRHMSGVRTLRSLRFDMPRLYAAAQAHGVYELAVVMASTAGGSVSVFVHATHEIVLEAPHLRLWSELGMHLSRAAALRHAIATAALTDADAVFSPHGNCVHAAPGLGAPIVARLRAQVSARERLRSGNYDDLDAVLDHWSSQVASGWTVVDQFDENGDRWLVVWPNALACHEPRGLGANERRMLQLVLEGSSNRLAAAELGISHASASRLLASALGKLGVRDLGALCAWRSRALTGELLAIPLGIEGLVAIGIPKAEAEASAGLTAGERAVFAELVRGRTNREIGALRGTSPRTVANQVRAIFDKLGVGSRRELLHRLGAR